MLQNLASLANVTNLIQFCDCFNLAKNKNLNYHVCFNICFLLFKAYFLCRVFWGIGEGWVNLFLIADDQFVQWIKRRSRKVFTNRVPIQSKKTHTAIAANRSFVFFWNRSSALTISTIFKFFFLDFIKRNIGVGRYPYNESFSSWQTRESIHKQRPRYPDNNNTTQPLHRVSDFHTIG